MKAFIIPFHLPGLNEVLGWKRVPLPKSSKGKGRPDLYSVRKKSVEGAVAAVVRVSGFREPLSAAAWQTVAFFDVSRRDRDNVPIGVKFINDCLVDLGLLPSDDSKWVSGITIHVTGCDRPGVLVAFDSAPLTLERASELYEGMRKK